VYLKSAVATFKTMSPEMLKGKTFGKRADSWALGCLLYQLLTGVHPFGDKKIEVFKILNDEPNFKRTEKIYSKELNEICAQLLLKHKRPKISEIVPRIEMHFRQL
jgi:serine/threonine protein kinase